MTIRVDDLSVRMGSRHVLERLSFSVTSGAVTAVLGPNGAGKTTLLRALAGLIEPTNGSVSIRGSDVRGLSRRHLSRRVALVPQEFEPHADYSCEEVILMGRSPHVGAFSTPGRADYEVVREVMELLGLTHLRHRGISRTSGGERRLVSIGAALAQQTDIVLLDEPTAHLDYRNSHMVLRLLRRLADGGGMSIVVTMHEVNQALSCADEALLLFGPGDYGFGAVREVVNQASLGRLYGTECRLISRDGLVAVTVPNCRSGAGGR